MNGLRRRRFLLDCSGLAAVAAAPSGQAGPPRSRASHRQFIDAAGRAVQVPLTVNRVADPWHANNAMVLMLGGAEKLVATSVQARRQPWLQKLYPPIASVPTAFDAAGNVNIETLIGARPDVVLMAYGGALPKWTDAVAAFGIPVVMLPNTSLADLKTTARMTGDILGERESQVAADYVRDFDDNIRRVRSRTDRIPRRDRPSVLHTASAGILTVDGHQTVVDDWIEVAGGVNAARVSGNGRPVTLEQVVAWDPDVIIVGTAPNQQSRQAILDDARWRQIKAVRNGTVFVNPTGAYLWDRHSAEAALQVLWAAQQLNPALFADIDIQQETRSFYARYFHHALTDADFSSIINATPP